MCRLLMLGNEKIMQPMSKVTRMDLRQQLLDESNTFMGIYESTRAPKPTQDQPIPIYITWGPT